MINVSTMRQLFIDEANRMNQTGELETADTVELTGVSFLADEDYFWLKPNEEYIDREIRWYRSKSRYVDDIEGSTPKIWEQVSSRHGRINSNYGWCVFSEENDHQYIKVLDELIRDRNTRRAVMIYTRPTMHEDAYDDGMCDFMCTNAVIYQIRGDRMNAIVQMRSNDAIYGYRNDVAWQRYMLRRLVRHYNHNMQLTMNENKMVEVGDITWQVASMHIYRRHWRFLGFPDKAGE